MGWLHFYWSKTARQRIKLLLSTVGTALTAKTIGDICNIGPGRIYGLLLVMENDGEVVAKKMGERWTYSLAVPQT